MVDSFKYLLAYRHSRKQCNKIHKYNMKQFCVKLIQCKYNYLVNKQNLNRNCISF